MNSGTKSGVARPALREITTPEAEHPSIKHASLWKLKVLGAIIVLVSLGFLYWSMFRPIGEAMRAGVHRHLYLDLGAIWLLWIGVWLLATDLRDKNLQEVGPDGQLRLNRKGRIARYSLLGGYAVVIFLVYLYLRAIGANPF